MIVSEETRAKRKEAQLARLAVRHLPEYAELYAKTPEQQRKAAVYRTQRQAVRALRLASQIEADSDADGAIATFGNMAVTMAQGSSARAGAKGSK